MPAPLYLKYRTSSKIPYLYDVPTKQIIRTNDTVYQIIDDVGWLGKEELLKTYAHLGENNVLEALSDLEAIHLKLCLLDHPPTILSPVQKVALGGRVTEPRTFLGDNHKLLILGITEECNLRCDYCIYGEHYASHRKHAPKHMPLAVARRAIDDFLQCSGDRVSLGFYGGEPLLCYDLIQECVRYAEQRASQLSKVVSFVITTNGTLLGKDQRQFLQEHGFLVCISVDGPKNMHDRYRVFRSSDGNAARIGSYDTVMRNLEAFRAEYPDYDRLGLFATLSPPYDMEACRSFCSEMLPQFPYSRVSFVQDEDLATAPWVQRPGCNPQTGCDSWVDVSREQVVRLVDEFRTGIAKDGYVTFAGNRDNALASRLFAGAVFSIHNRPVTDKALQVVFGVNCLPGHERLFCGVDGTYYPCEKTVNCAGLALGNVFSGFDADKATSLLDSVRSIADCGNCVCQGVCTNCYMVYRWRDGHIDADDMSRKCVENIRQLRSNLRLYTEIMEHNPEAFVGTLNGETEGEAPILLARPTQNGRTVQDGACGEDKR